MERAAERLVWIIMESKILEDMKQGQALAQRGLLRTLNKTISKNGKR